MPVTETVEVYSDASVRNNSLRVGFVVKDADGRVIAREGRDLQRHQHSTQGELIAVLHSVRYVLRELDGVEEIKLYGDSHSVMKMLDPRADPTPNKRDIRQLVDCAYKLLRRFKKISVSYLPSSLNVEAHNTAYFAGEEAILPNILRYTHVCVR